MNRLIILLIATLVMGCSANKKVDIVSIGKVSPKEVSNTGIAMTIETVINNELNKKITLEKADFNIFHNDRQIASVEMSDVVTISPKQQNSYTIPLRMRVGRNVINELIPIILKPSGFRIEGTIIGRVGIFRKKIKFNRDLTDKDLKEITKQIRHEIGI